MSSACDCYVNEVNSANAHIYDADAAGTLSSRAGSPSPSSASDPPGSHALQVYKTRTRHHENEGGGEY